MRTVLVVEDEVIIRTLAVELLEEAGYRVVDFNKAADAMAFCENRKNEVTAVFTDINMPGDLDGIDVAQLAAITHPKAVVIVTSGRYGMKPPDLPAKVKFLPKPWTASGLLAAVASIPEL